MDQEDPAKFQKAFAMSFIKLPERNWTFLLGYYRSKSLYVNSNVIYMIGNDRKQSLGINDRFLTEKQWGIRWNWGGRQKNKGSILYAVWLRCETITGCCGH